MASQNLGSRGTAESEPVFCEWRWRYSAPSLAIWVMLGALLIVPRSNRNWQAWLILAPLALVLAPWMALSAVLSAPSSTVDGMAFFTTALAMAWVAVWLIGHWLGRIRRSMAFLAASGVMLLTGAMAYLGYYGVTSPGEWAPALILHAAFSLALLSAMSLSGYCCRSNYRPWRFMLFLMLWIVPAVAAGLSVFAIAQVAITGELIMLVLLLPMVIVGSLFAGGLLYLMNLPFMLLAFANSGYGDRFQSAFRLQEVGSSPFAPTALSASPFGAPSPEPLPERVLQSPASSE